MTEQITPRQFHETEGVEDWRVVGEAVSAFFRTGSFETGAKLVQAIAELPGIDDQHHPDVDVRWEGVTVRLTTITATHFYDGHSTRDVELARQISAVARDLGIPADSSVVQNLQVTVDALVIPDVMPFWRAALGYVDRVDTTEDLIDPRGRGPSVWFQQMETPRQQRNRIHVDIAVPFDQAEARTAAVLAAGGAGGWSTIREAAGWPTLRATRPVWERPTGKGFNRRDANGRRRSPLEGTVPRPSSTSAGSRG